ncbi:type VI secretion system Vgr family protein [Capnocytophaga endodontalis]|uniref:Type IV secretion protein Rhs n=1 Tax=Capnocytophaga endodontalis TaxID=2708117 RepID=A0A1Z4BQH7_9FLAO|nr:type VI secretion system tip protein VgrG [Capnocytophaga endodontalis]ASF43509.1 type IV secretion protein Rhs [Capnocytophaga endodontalis]
MENNTHNTSSVPGRVNDPQTLARFASIKSYDDYVKDKNNPVVMVTLTLGDQPFLNKNHFETFLTQHTNAHDEFTIVVSDTAIDDFYGQVMKNSKNLLGEKITIHFHQKGNIIQSFKGIIANICNKKNEGGGYGNLYISGFAPSILLDSGKECQSYENKTLKEIVAQATEEYKEVTINTDGLLNTKYQIPYVVQYKESDYQFIQRLARRYGEFFYYNGTQLMFNNETQKTVTLLEGGDLINVEFELMIKPQNFSYISYDVETGNTEQKTTQEVHLQDKINPFQYAAIKASEKVFTKKPTIPYNAISEQFRGDYLKDVVRREKESREQLMQVRGKSRNPHLRIGGFIKLKDINDKPMESYRIIDIKHHQSGYDYENEFIAIPDVYIAYYYDEQALPRAEQQVARVTDNNDPKGLGRVRVQFIWQEKHQTKTPWIRVVQPHAGGGKGFYFIPEIGEEVWVDFEDQNAERPVVVGSNYNGKEYSPFHNTNNDIKAIQTRSGHKLVFTEDESILLSDKNGNTLRFDTQGKNIEISAPESISLCAGKDLNLSAGNNLVMDVANTAFFNVLQQMLVTTPFMKQLIADYFHTQAGKALINSDQEIKIEARETNVAGTEKLLVHSDRNATLNSKGVLSVKGEQGNKYTNKAEEFPKEEIILDAEALLVFRPTNLWPYHPTFGFDWYREGFGADGIAKTDIATDVDICEIAGYYPDNNSKNSFQLDPNIAKDLKSEYLRMNSKQIIAPYEYLIPKLTLYKHENENIESSAILDIKYEIYGDKDLLKEFFLEYEEDFFKIAAVDISTFEEIENGKVKNYEPPKNYTTFKIDTFARNMNIKIECLKPFGDLRGKFIKAYTLTADTEGKEPIKKCAGVLQVMPNSKNNRKVVKLLLVNVMTNVNNSRTTQYGYDTARLHKEKENVRMFLRQALIDPIFKDEKLNLSGKGGKTNIKARDEFNHLYVLANDLLFAYDFSGRTRKENIVVYLYKKLQELNPQALEEGYLPVFFVPMENLKSINSDGVEESLAGYCMVDKQLIIISKGAVLGDFAHEVFHSLKLPHTWEHKNHIKAGEIRLTVPNGKYSFEFMKTCNIMDYSHLKYHIYHWQAKIANGNALVEPDNYKPEQL